MSSLFYHTDWKNLTIFLLHLEIEFALANSNPCDFFLCHFDKFSESAVLHGECVLYQFHLLGIQYFLISFNITFGLIFIVTL